LANWTAALADVMNKRLVGTWDYSLPDNLFGPCNPLKLYGLSTKFGLPGENTEVDIIYPHWINHFAIDWRKSGIACAVMSTLHENWIFSHSRDCVLRAGLGSQVPTFGDLFRAHPTPLPLSSVVCFLIILQAGWKFYWNF